MAEIFSVSTDYLLKDEQDRPVAQASEDSGKELRKVSMEEANAFLKENDSFSKKISTGTLICTLCPIPLLAVMALQKTGTLPLSEDPAGAIGIILLLIMVAISLIFFIPAAMSRDKWDYLEKVISRYRRKPSLCSMARRSSCLISSTR